MNIAVVIQQMIMIFILIGVGLLLYRKNILDESSSRQLSGLIVNVTNPALLICSAFNGGPKMSLRELGMAFVIFLIVYILLIAAAFLIPRILRVPNEYHYSYQLLTIFGNVGFIGIPLASAVLGPESLIFVSIYNLIYNVLIYTLGILLLRKAATRQAASRCSGTEAVPGNAQEAGAPSAQTDSHTFADTPLWKKLVNAGTLSAAATILFYVGDFPVPSIVPSTLNYMGQCTTLLSMLVLGISVAQMKPGDIFTHPKLYGFILLRQILIPIGFVFLLRPFIDNMLITGALTLMLAVPAGNLPLMLSKQFGADGETISQGIILSTLFSLVTLPVVSLVLSV